MSTTIIPLFCIELWCLSYSQRDHLPSDSHRAQYCHRDVDVTCQLFSLAFRVVSEVHLELISVNSERMNVFKITNIS